jgi:hypothetical protein
MGRRSGKTYTALLIARGMVGPKGRIGVLDTESGRARLYSDKVPGGFVVGELTPPYTPRRYLEAIEEFLSYGVDILVVDSFSHCWEGPGGVLQMADQAEESGKKGLSKWLVPKRDYKGADPEDLAPAPPLGQIAWLLRPGLPCGGRRFCPPTLSGKCRDRADTARHLRR